jgi:phage shock protein A
MTDRKISYEDAFPTFQRRCTELFEANLLLEAQVAALGRQLEAARAENEQLMAAATDPTPAGPDLAAVPAYPGQEPA